MTTFGPADRCLYCPRRGTFRIATSGLGFDELACFRHMKTLQLFADRMLGGARQFTQTGSSVRRGGAL